jgi:deoxyribonuclease V
LAAQRPPPWKPGREPLAIGGCYAVFARGQTGAGRGGDAGWAAAAVLVGAAVQEVATAAGPAGGPYRAGALALREGPLLAAAVRSLARRPDVLLVPATGRDHPRRAGLALHLGAVLGLPTVGVTDHPFVADGPWPGPNRSARAPLSLEGDLVGYWVRTRTGVRPVAVHAGWRTDPDTAAAVVLAATKRRRLPEPLRVARRLAREARATGSAL